jgi:hypothetical protein
MGGNFAQKVMPKRSLPTMRGVNRATIIKRANSVVKHLPCAIVSHCWLSGKISRMTADLLTKYLYRLGREVTVKTRAGSRTAALA